MDKTWECEACSETYSGIAGAAYARHYMIEIHIVKKGTDGMGDGEDGGTITVCNNDDCISTGVEATQRFLMRQYGGAWERAGEAK